MELEDMYKSLRIFSLFANKDISIWENIIGCKINHKYYGLGIINKIINQNESIYIYIEFDELYNKENIIIFNNLTFKENYFENINFDFLEIKGYKEFCKKKIDEQKIKMNYDILKKKYKISIDLYPNISSELYGILIKLDSNVIFDDKDIKWLEKEKLNKILILCYKKKYQINNDLWSLVKAAKILRKEDRPSEAIEILDKKCTKNNKLMSAILTVKGSAYRDINELKNAENLAIKAIKIRKTNAYPYNLLGAIYYQIGEVEKGDKYFKKAHELQPNVSNIDLSIRNSLERANKNEKKHIINYLLEKDKLRYDWVKKYKN